MTIEHEADVVIIGAGPSGLSAALTLRGRGIERIIVIEREREAGGIPRHCHHGGFGIRDLHRCMSGPRYAAELTRRVTAARIPILLSTTATGLDAGTVQTTSPSGVRNISTRAILVASGARERPRSARLVPGDRPSGIFTTGQLQQWVYQEHLPVGSRAIVVGAENVSISALLTLRHAGVSVVAFTTELPHHQSVRGAALALRARYGVSIRTSTKLVEINGRHRVEEVVVEELTSGRRSALAVDTVVFTGDWIPDNDFVRRAHVAINSGTLGPATDDGGRSSVDALYAVGNLIHPVETADVASLRSRVVAHAIADDLHAPSTHTWIDIIANEQISWVWPNRVRVGLSVDSFSLRSLLFDSARKVTAHQGGVVLGTSRIGRIVPNRSLSFSGRLIENADKENGSIHFSLSS
jgi:thioredoxin reductase